MMQSGVHHRLDESKEQMRHHAILLREYAKWRLIRGHVFPPGQESQRRELMRQFLETGAAVQLTERDLVRLLYRGLFSSASSTTR